MAAGNARVSETFTDPIQDFGGIGFAFADGPRRIMRRLEMGWTKISFM
jgi:hypothetical protein